MRGAVALLVLLFCLPETWTQGETDVIPQPGAISAGDDIHIEDRGVEAEDLPPLPAIWDELMGLKDTVLSLRTMVVEQRLALRNLESRVRDHEVEEEEQRDRIHNLEITVAEQNVELRNMEAGVNSSQNLVTDLGTAQRATRNKMEELAEENAGKE